MCSENYKELERVGNVRGDVKIINNCQVCEQE